MGTIKDFGKKAVEATKSAAEWASYHVWDAVQIAGCFFAGYGISSFIFDVTGVTDKMYDGMQKKGELIGYNKGFQDGQTSAAKLIGVANGVNSPNQIEK